MSGHIPKNVPDLDHYVIGDFTTVTNDGAIRYSIIRSCVVFVVSCCVTHRSTDFVCVVISESTGTVCRQES